VNESEGMPLDVDARTLGIGTGRRSGDGAGEGGPCFDPRGGGGGGGGLLTLTFKSDDEDDERK
jgi:hypothetical protein